MLSSDTHPDPSLLFFSFEWAFLDFHGLAPEVGICVSCGGDPGPGKQGVAWFSTSEGGVLCADCRRRDGIDSRPLGTEALWWLQQFSATGLSGAGAREFGRPVRRELGVILHRFLGYHLPGYRLPAALDILRPVNRPKET